MDDTVLKTSLSSRDNGSYTLSFEAFRENDIEEDANWEEQFGQEFAEKILSQVPKENEETMRIGDDNSTNQRWLSIIPSEDLAEEMPQMTTSRSSSPMLKKSPPHGAFFQMSDTRESLPMQQHIPLSFPVEPLLISVRKIYPNVSPYKSNRILLSIKGY
jgi:hypothetical protein